MAVDSATLADLPLDSLQQEFLESARSAIARCADSWNEPDLAERLTLSVSPRLRRSLGRCYPERGLVYVARFALQFSAELRVEIVTHEVAHLVVFQRHGRRCRPHGAEWKSLMRSLGLTPRIRIQLARPEAALPAGAIPTRVLYEHRCPVCHSVSLARRRMNRWRCRECVTVGLPGMLEISRTVGSELSL
jgi:predicted SprT family Zn-dependent metalloprotease